MGFGNAASARLLSAFCLALAACQFGGETGGDDPSGQTGEGGGQDDVAGRGGEGGDEPPSPGGEGQDDGAGGATPDAGLLLDADPPAGAACPHLTCEDFESGGVGADWRAGAQISVSKENAAHGEWSAKLRINPGSTGSFMQMKKALGNHEGPLFGRFNMFLSRAHEWGTSYVLRMGSDSALEFGGKLGTWHITPLAVRQTGKVTFPSGKWVCITWAVSENPVTIKVSTDGKLVGQVAVPGSSKVPSYEPLRLGMFLYHPEDVKTAFDIYFDDVVVSSSPVACLP